ncbi:MAG: hypothetical protein ACYDDF_04790 [Thermoplasmatota archaeon]
MYPLGHIGIPVAAADAGRGRFAWLRRLHLGWLGWGAIFPDVLDKGILLFTPGAPTRAYGHTIWLVLGLLLASFLAWRTSAGWPLLAVALGDATHLVLDVPISPVVLAYPLLGPFPVGSASPNWIQELLTDPMNWGGEILGAAALAWVAYRRTRLARATHAGR